MLALKPGVPATRLFLAFCLAQFAIPALYARRVHSTYLIRRGSSSPPFAFLPALLLHLALTFPQRRSIVRRRPWIVWVPYLDLPALIVRRLVA